MYIKQQVAIIIDYSISSLQLNAESHLSTLNKVLVVGERRVNYVYNDIQNNFNWGINNVEPSLQFTQRPRVWVLGH